MRQWHSRTAKYNVHRCVGIVYWVLISSKLIITMQISTITTCLPNIPFLPRYAAMLARSWGSYFCPSVRHMLLYDETKELTDKILTPFERVINLVFWHQTRLGALSPSTWSQGVTYALYLARWKARGRLPIRYIWTFFASSHGSDFISRYWSKSAFLKGVGHFKCKF